MRQQLALKQATVGPGNTVVLTVSGEVDLVTADDFEAHLKSVLSPPNEVVILDLSEVTFFSSAGLSVLLASAESAESSGIRFRLVTTERVVLRPLEITGVSGAFTVFDSVDEAIASTQYRDSP